SDNKLKYYLHKAICLTMVILRQVFDLDFQMGVTQIDFFSRLKLAIEDYSHCFFDFTTTSDSTGKGRLFNSFPDSGGEDTELSLWNCHPLTTRPIPRHPEFRPT